MKAILVLEDGTVFEGRSVGAAGTTVGEVVFNTGMTGYQEILTDPSYAGQMVTLTYPIIGNYGINPDDFESRQLQPRALIIRDMCDAPSNWRCRWKLAEYLRVQGMPSLDQIDTRALTRVLRSHGVMMGILTTELTVEEALRHLKAEARYEQLNYVRQVTTTEPYVWDAEGQKPVNAPQLPGTRYRLTLLDCGVKYNILRRFADQGARVTVMPCIATAEDVLNTQPDGVVLSPGPGDPALLEDVVRTVRTLADKRPIFGICLGNQMVGAAFGAHTYKLKFGHRGCNHPVKDLVSGKVTITSQNHGFAVDPSTLQPGMEVWQMNLNDGTVEGLRHTSLPIFTIQYHPEAAPGPRDSDPYFAQFLQMLDETGGVQRTREATVPHA